MKRHFYNEREMTGVTGIDMPRLQRLIDKGEFPAPHFTDDGRKRWPAPEVELWEQLRSQGVPWKRRRTAPGAETELYRHFDTAGRLLYVGIAFDSVVRLKGHQRAASWFKQVTTITIQRFPTRAEAEAAEREAIKAEKPLHNIAHAKC
jgi:predicted DNA-binding transcriptional regulator AlpA